MLDCLAYYLLLGHTDGIITDYKRVMHAKREIPVSSCQSSVENVLYATSGGTESVDMDESERFNLMLDRLDHKASIYDVQKKQKKKIESGQHKRARLGIHGGEWCRVDTDNKFWFGNKHYIINDQAVQYAPVETEFGEYYTMDKILASGGKFYDMNYDEVEVSCIGGLLKYEDCKDWISVW